MSTPTSDPEAICASVRRNAIWAAGAAVIMLYFGMGKSVPAGTIAPQTQGWALFLYTLKIGGAAMALSALLSLLGLPLALMYDAVVSVVIGMALALSGALIYPDNSYQAIFNIVFGILFGYCGWRNWQEFNVLSPADTEDPSADPEHEDSAPPTDAPARE